MNGRRLRGDRGAGRPQGRRPQSDPLPGAKLWSVPVQVADVPETGRRFELVADPAVRDGVARAAGVVALPRLEASFNVVPLANGGLRVTGAVSARVDQTCVVTLEPMTSQIEEPVDLTFVPPGDASSPSVAVVADADDDNPPEALEGGGVDLGVVATEFLMLGIDPHPRKPGARFDVPRTADEPAARPFAALAALAALKKDSGTKQG